MKFKKSEEGASLPLFVVTLGSATVDIVISHSQNEITVPSHGKQLVDHVTYSVGGGGLNAAINFATENIAVAPIAIIGNDSWAEFIIDNLKKNNVNPQHLIVKDVATRSSFIFPSHKNETSILCHATSQHLLQAAEINFDVIAKANLLYISSVNLDDPYDLIKIVQFAHAQNIMMMLNPNKNFLTQHKDIIKRIIPYITIFMCNQHEAQLFLDEKNIQKNIKTVHDMGAHITIITCDSQGAYVAQNEQIIHQESFPTEVINTTGAGDAFGAIFAASFIKKGCIVAALDSALQAASEVVATNQSSLTK